MTWKFKKGEKICECGTDLTTVEPASYILRPVPDTVGPDLAPDFECPTCGRTTRMIAEEELEPEPEPAPEVPEPTPTTRGGRRRISGSEPEE